MVWVSQSIGRSKRELVKRHHCDRRNDRENVQKRRNGRVNNGSINTLDDEEKEI